MNKKYIESSLMLTKEAFNDYILRQQSTQAALYGLTLEQYQQAIVDGGVVTQQLLTSSLLPR